MQTLFFVILLLGSWGAMSFFEYETLRTNGWWRRFAHQRRFEELRMRGLIEKEHYLNFEYRGKASPSKSTRASPKAKEASQSQEGEGQKEEEKRFPLELVRDKSVPQSMRFPLEEALYRLGEPQGELWFAAWSRLLHNLYHAYPFYQEALEQDAQVPQNLLKAIFAAISARKQAPEKQKVERTSWDLLDLDLGDAQLQALWYEMTTQRRNSPDGFPVPHILRYAWFKDWVTAPEPCAVNIHYCEYPVMQAVLGEKVAQYLWGERLGMLRYALKEFPSYRLEQMDQYALQEAWLTMALREQEEHLPAPLSKIKPMISLRSKSDHRKPIEKIVLVSRYGGKSQPWQLLRSAKRGS